MTKSEYRKSVRSSVVDFQFEIGDGIVAEYDISSWTLKIVRARMKKMGLIKRISHFNPHRKYTAGWTFSPRFAASLEALAESMRSSTKPASRQNDEQKDRDSIHYI